jgi:hypothetical protein
MLKENNVRRGFLQDEQYLRLSRECAVEGIWLVGLFETAYAYGWREDELLTLQIGQLDLLAKIIDLGETKNGDSAHDFDDRARVRSPRAVRVWQKAGRFCVHPR